MPNCIDAPFVNLTPGTRSGLIYNTAYATLCEALQPLEHKLVEVIEEQRRAEEEQVSQEQLRTIQRAVPRGAAGVAGRGI